MNSTPSAYPFRLRIDHDQQIGRLWAIPIIGWAARSVVVIPHLIVLGVLSFLVGLSAFVVWIPILISGRFPGWAYDLYVLTYGLSARVSAYVLLMVGPYPPFNASDPYPVTLEVDRTERINQLWGLPLIGYIARSIAAIPSAIGLYAVSIAAFVVILVAWIPVLISGRYPQWGYTVVGGYLRWTMRLSLWTLLVPAPYPPFRLED